MSYFDDCEKLMFQIYSNWEQTVYKSIGKEVKRLGRLTAKEAMQINNIAVAKRSFNLAMTELSNSTGIAFNNLITQYSSAIKEAKADAKNLYDYRGIPFNASDERLKAIVTANIKATMGTMLNMTNTKLIGVTVNGQFQPLQRELQELFGRVLLQAQTGAEDINTAVRNGLKVIGDSGLKVDYGSGVHRRIDSVMRQNVLYGMKNMYREYNASVGDILGCDGVEIDYHANCRPSHVFMQGRQFAKGKAVTIHGVRYPSIDDVIDGNTVRQAIEDYGCRHFETDIILGVSEPAIDEDKLKELKKRDATPLVVGGVAKTGYEWTQSMRNIESSYRSLSGQQTILSNAGMDTAGIQEKMDALEAKYKQIEKETGIKGFVYKFEIV